MQKPKFSTETLLVWCTDRRYMAVHQFGAKASTEEGSADIAKASQAAETQKGGLSGGQMIGEGPFLPAEVVDLHDCPGANECGPGGRAVDVSAEFPDGLGPSHQQSCRELWPEGCTQIVRLNLPEGGATRYMAGTMFMLAEETTA